MCRVNILFNNGSPTSVQQQCEVGKAFTYWEHWEPTFVQQLCEVGLRIVVILGTHMCTTAM